MPTTPPPAARLSIPSSSCVSSAWRPVKLAISRGNVLVAAAAAAPGASPRTAASTSAAGPRPRAAATNSARPASCQAQRIGEQQRGVFVRGAVDAAFQVTDRPGADARRLRQLLLGQPCPRSQLPQQAGETQRAILGHVPSVPPCCLPPAGQSCPNSRQPGPPLLPPAVTHSGPASAANGARSGAQDPDRLTYRPGPVGCPVGDHAWSAPPPPASVGTSRDTSPAGVHRYQAARPDAPRR